MRIIDDCLLQKKYWSKQDLIDRIEAKDLKVSERTLEKDISDMKSSTQLGYFAPVKFCKTNKGYHYTREYSIYDLPLNQTDVKALELAATTLDQYRYIPFMAEFTTTIDKIIRVVNRVKMDNHATILDFIEFEKTPVAAGLEFMNTIIYAIQNKQALEISYQKFSNLEPEMVRVHPYFLKEYRNRWYIIGYSDKRKEIRTYAFDRMKCITNSRAEFVPNTFIETKEYLKNCIGVNLRDGKIERVRLQFTPAEAMYVKTQRLHHSQETVQDDAEAFIIDLNVVVNFELVGIILGYGPKVKVLDPPSLADKVKQIAEDVLARYS